MELETITENEALLIRRMILKPNECMYWHTDSCSRFTVVVQGSRLAIEFRDTTEIVEIGVYPGMTGWDDPEPKTHRAVNRGSDTYEEVVTFYKQSPDVVPQPGSPTPSCL